MAFDNPVTTSSASLTRAAGPQLSQAQETSPGARPPTLRAVEARAPSTLPPSAQTDAALPLIAAAAHTGMTNLSLRDGAPQAYEANTSASATTSMPAQTTLAPANTAGTDTTTTTATATVIPPAPAEIIPERAYPVFRPLETMTQLMLAAKCGATSTVRALLDAGAEVDQPDHTGKTALMWAAENGNTPALQALLKAGARVDRTDADGMTPMLRAARHGDTATLEALLQPPHRTRAYSWPGLANPMNMGLRRITGSRLAIER